MSGEDTEDVYVFLKRIDKNDVKEKLSDEYGRNMDIYENSDKFYSEVLPELIVGNQPISRIAGTSNLTEDFLTSESVDSVLNLITKKEILAKIQNEMNEYIAGKRSTYKDLIGDYASEILTSNSIDKDDMIFESDYAEFFIAKLDKEQIIKLSHSSFVESISCFVDFEQTAGYAVHAVSESTKDNVEIIEFRATSSGTYNLQLRMLSSILEENNNSELHYWISWRIY